MSHINAKKKRFKTYSKKINAERKERSYKQKTYMAIAAVPEVEMARIIGGFFR